MKKRSMQLFSQRPMQNLDEKKVKGAIRFNVNEASVLKLQELRGKTR
jgi:hypothetical protein